MLEALTNLLHNIAGWLSFISFGMIALSLGMRFTNFMYGLAVVVKVFFLHSKAALMYLVCDSTFLEESSDPNGICTSFCNKSSRSSLWLREPIKLKEYFITYERFGIGASKHLGLHYPPRAIGYEEESRLICGVFSSKNLRSTATPHYSL